MRNWLYILIFVFLAMIAQTTLIPSFFSTFGNLFHSDVFANQSINVIFLILMYICFTRDFFPAMFWLFAFVLIQNSFDSPWKGSLALSYIFTMILVYILKNFFTFQYTFSSMLIISVLIVLQNIFHAVLGSLFVGFEAPMQGEIFYLFVNVLLCILIIPPLFSILYYIDLQTTFHFDKSKSFFGRRVGL